MTTTTLPWIEEATAGFVNSEPMRDAVSLALASGMNVLLSGPGGHGKSEFLEAVFSAIGGMEPYVKSLGQGTTTEELFGGIDLDALNRPVGATIQYNVNNSFLPHKVAIFEELFDAPPRVLTALKDTITARRLRNGSQRYDMATSVIAAATNHCPQDIAALGSTVAALVERFPIQVEVNWSVYTPQAFTHLFDTVLGATAPGEIVEWDDIVALQDRATQVKVNPTIRRILAGVLSELRTDKVAVSPRTAMYALRLVQAGAAINGRTAALPEDVHAVTYLPGCQAHKASIQEWVAEITAASITIQQVEMAEEALNGFLAEASTDLDLAGLGDLADRVASIQADANHIRVDDSLAEKIQLVRSGYAELMRILEGKINEATLAEAQAQADSLMDQAERELRKLRGAMSKSHDLNLLMQNRRSLHDLKRRVGEIRPNDLGRLRHEGLVSDVAIAIGAYDLKISSKNNGWSRS